MSQAEVSMNEVLKQYERAQQGHIDVQAAGRERLSHMRIRKGGID